MPKIKVSMEVDDADIARLIDAIEELIAILDRSEYNHCPEEGDEDER